jgi:hypothetical protein
MKNKKDDDYVELFSKEELSDAWAFIIQLLNDDMDYEYPSEDDIILSFRGENSSGIGVLGERRKKM